MKIYGMCVLMLMVLVSAMALTACGPGTTANIVEGISVSSPQEVPYSYTINNKKLAGKINVTRLNARDVDGIAQAQVTIVNLKKDTVRFEYRVQWFDEDGFEITSGVQPWKPDLVYGKMQKMIMATGTSPQAVRYRIAFRLPQETWKELK